MKKFEISRVSFEGKVTVIYDSSDMLQMIDFSECKLDAKGRNGFKSSIPIYSNEILAFAQRHDCTMREVAFVITFEMWYTDYGVKRNKIEAEKLWNKMPSEEHLECWLSNKPYKNYCQRNASWYNQMYPDTYLRKKHYKDEWNKI